MPPDRPYSALTGQEKAVELLRWLAVLPAAWLGYRAILFVAGLVMFAAIQAEWNIRGTRDFADYVPLIVFYAPKLAAFVIVGAKIAPRRRLATSIVLAAAAILLSLAIHILVQENVGFANYLHFSLETIGALAGAAYIVYSEAVRQRPAV